MMKMKKMSSKLIKPESPTPESLKNYYISFIDQCVGAMNLGVVLLYRRQIQMQMQMQIQSKEKRQLEESLAEILIHFYPLAGRYVKNDHCVDCSDQGVEWVEAEATDSFELEADNSDQVSRLLPDQYFRVGEAAHDPLLSIQATHFPCGGLAIGISVSHRVFDAWSLGTFIAAWSAAASSANSSYTGVSSWDILPSLLPHNPDHRRFHIDHSEAAEKIATKRLVFKFEEEEAFKDASSRVRGAIAKALIRVDGGRSRDFVIFEPVNMRGKTADLIHAHACGNLAVASVTPRVPASIEMEELVRVIDDAVDRAVADHAQILSGDGRQLIINSLGNLGKEMMNPGTKAIVFSDWSKCGFQFYEADFGWGKPVLTSVAPHRPFNNSTVLLSTKEGDGIEAWVNLNRDDMRCFLQDHQIKLFSTNPLASSSNSFLFGPTTMGLLFPRP